MKEDIVAVLSDNPSYGHRRIALALKKGTRTIRRIMRKFNIKPYKRQARWRKRRDERRAPAPYQNLIKHICPRLPGVVFVSDFTYIKYREKFVYLATFMDRYTREIIGWHVSSHHTKELVLKAFWDAVQNSGTFPHIVHSDQGVEYTNETYTKLMDKLNISISMSTKASPWENAYQESFYNNFKTDLGLEFERFSSLGELIEAIHHTIMYYNHHRIHTSLKMSPSHYHQQHQKVLEKSFNKTGT